MARLVSFGALLAIVVLISLLFFQVMAVFLVPMFVAVVLVIVFQPLHQWFIQRCGGRVHVAAGLTTLAILLIVLLPFGLIVSRAAAEGWALVSQLDQETLALKIQRLRERLLLVQPAEDVIVALERIGVELDKLADDPFPSDAQRQDLDKLLSRMETVQAWIDDPQLQAQRQASQGLLAGEDAWRAAATELNDLLLQLRAHPLAADPRPQEPNAESDQPTVPPDGHSYAALIAQARNSHLLLKRQLLGDEVTQWIRAKANPRPEELGQLRAWLQDLLAPAALKIAPLALKILIGFIVMIVSLYYFLADGPTMLTTVMRLSPLDGVYVTQLLGEFANISRAVVVATLLAALVQGVLAGIGFHFAGVQAVFLLTVLTMVGAMVPFVGAAAIWIPVSLWLLVEGHYTAGGLLALYGACIVSTSDNIIKPLVLHGQSNLHPLLALISVLGGVIALGPIGVFVGPMAVVFLQVVLQMLNVEMAHWTGRSSGKAKAQRRETRSAELGLPPGPWQEVSRLRR